METTNLEKQGIISCNEIFTEENGSKVMRLVDYDLSGLKFLIETGGIDFIIDGLKDLYDDLVLETLKSLENHESKSGISENNPNFSDQMFVLNALRELFEEAKENTYSKKLKDYPIVKERNNDRNYLSAIQN